MNIKTFFLKYSDFVYKSRLRAMVIEIAIVFLLQVLAYYILFGSENLIDLSVVVVSIVIGIASGNLFYELNKKKGLV